MFNFNPNAGKLNKPMSFSVNAEQNPLAAFGGGTKAPMGGPPTTGGGIDPAMLMAMISGGGMGGGQQTNPMQVSGPEYQGGGNMMPGQMPFNTQKSPYQMAVMKALMGGMG